MTTPYFRCPDEMQRICPYDTAIQCWRWYSASETPGPPIEEFKLTDKGCQFFDPLVTDLKSIKDVVIHG